MDNLESIIRVESFDQIEVESRYLCGERVTWVEVYLGPSQESIPVDNIESQVPRVEPN